MNCPNTTKTELPQQQVIKMTIPLPPRMHSTLATAMLLVMTFSSSCQDKNTLTQPKNVILMIGDGMGYNCLKAAEFYFGPSPLSQFSYSTGVATFYAGSGYDPALAWSDPEYITRGHTESAAAATAMATGFKTTLNTIGLSPAGDTLMNLTELAKLMGKAAGVITTVPFSHATPAAFMVHNSSRSNYRQIAYDILFRSRCDVVMGCGNPEFDEDGAPMLQDWEFTGYIGDSATWQALKEGSGTVTEVTADGRRRTVQDVSGDGIPDPWTVITSAIDLRNLASGPTPVRVLGCPEVHTTLQQARTQAGGETKDSPPFVTPFNTGVPGLSEMVMCGLNVLDNNPSGFFLMVEGGAIDWANHENQKGRMLEEMKSFRDAVEAVTRWIETNSSWEETLLIVTADHECGNLWGGETFVPVGDNGPGNLPTLQYNSHDHTNSLVALYARGQGATLLMKQADETDPVRGPYIQNNEIPMVVFRLWGRN
jgi:alkaline phosphatase